MPITNPGDHNPDGAPFDADKAAASILAGTAGAGNQTYGALPPLNVPGEWVSPSVKNQRRQQAIMPGLDLGIEQRLHKISRFGGMPEPLAQAVQAARDEIALARQVIDENRHPENPRFIASPAVRPVVVEQIEKAKRAVSDAEQLAKDPEIQQEWLDAVAGDLKAKQRAAAKALRAAKAAYADWAMSRSNADALSQQHERYGRSWLIHTRPHDMDPIGHVGRLDDALALASSDDEWVSGEAILKDYDEPPAFVIERYETAAAVAPGTSWQFGLHRLKQGSKDPYVAQALAAKDWRLLDAAPGFVEAGGFLHSADGERADGDDD